MVSETALVTVLSPTTEGKHLYLQRNRSTVMGRLPRLVAVTSTPSTTGTPSMHWRLSGVAPFSSMKALLKLNFRMVRSRYSRLADKIKLVQAAKIDTLARIQNSQAGMCRYRYSKSFTSETVGGGVVLRLTAELCHSKVGISTTRPCYPSVSHLAARGNTLSRESIGNFGAWSCISRKDGNGEAEAQMVCHGTEKNGRCTKARWAKIKAAKK
jgi:hypothetical protein